MAEYIVITRAIYRDGIDSMRDTVEAETAQDAMDSVKDKLESEGWHILSQSLKSALIHRWEQ